ncbi:MAG: hypothetical protein ABJG47_10320 [Ekhidna sp.]
MGDHLEKFIMENRASFDDAVPTEKAWEGIDRKLSKKQSNWHMIWKAAAVLFMVSTIYLIIDKSQSGSQDEAFLSDEFTQAEEYYVSLIAQRKQAIVDQLTPEKHEQFLVEIDQLDSMYLDLKKTYQTNASNDRVMDAMISNLQLRLNILNKQLDILQNIKNQNNENDTSIEI